MAQDIIITPRSGEPRISFTGSGTTASSINLNVLSDSTLSFEGTVGQLFSITNNLTSGVIFGVNDIGGLPLIEASANGNVSLVRYGNNVGIGTGSPSAKLDILETWNTSAVQTGIKLNIIDVSSNANSNLIELQNSGQTRFSFRKDGNLTIISGTVQTPTLRLQGSDRFGDITPASFEGGIGLKGGLNVFAPNYLDGAAIYLCNANGVTANVLRHENVNDVLALRRSTNPNTFRIYNTFTDFSNYERTSLGWNASAFEIETEASGTGLARNLIIGTSGIPRIFVSSTGQIGIGTTNPQYKIHVSGYATSFEDPNKDQIIYVHANGSGTGGEASIFLRNYLNDTAYLRMYAGARYFSVGQGSDSRQDFAGQFIRSYVLTHNDFYTNQTLGAVRIQNRSMFIGNNITPSATLHVSGNTILDGSSVTFATDGSGGNFLRFYRVASNSWRLTAPAIGDIFRFEGNFAYVDQDLKVRRGGLEVINTYTVPAEPIKGTITFNDGTKTYTAFKLDVTDTSSAANSNLIDAHVSGVSKFKVDKYGSVSAVNYYNSSGALPTTISTLYDVSGSVIPAEGYILIYTSGKWVAMPPTIDGGSASG